MRTTAAIFIVFLIIFSCKGEKEGVFPEKTDLTTAVYASVTVRPDSLYQLYARVSGIIDRNLVREGDTVRRNQKLIQIINDTPEISKENAKLALELARRNYLGSHTLLQELEQELQTAYLKYRNDSVNFFRQKNLWENQIGSKNDYDTRKLQYELSGNQFELLQNRYDRMKHELKTALKTAENNYRASLITEGDFTIKSRIDGVVYSLTKEPGEKVNPQEPLGSVGSSHHFLVEMLVDETDIVRVSPGQKAFVSLDAYPQEIFEIRVKQVLPSKDIRNQTFTVEGEFIKPPERLYPGLAGEANIIIETRRNTLTIPREYLASGKVLTDRGLVPVKTGISNLEKTEILEGIDSTTRIYMPER
ncbi:efflux RND transporter periplasmic adaptor subunit [Robertkochia aurantiaca]|uniref:efflux RND transporter periplasmic adaptor subunit n=1 Tax=Robertkochia aurantiaca TaxID=2873700 RepID=UPI001CCB2DB3|nr:efflux RND transporter periplasmic adaptor subunit [Robertkochia sp. 3YJGBD-33]